MQQQSAVLVVDVQKALCCGKEATYMAIETINKINQVIAKARVVDVPIIFIQHETPLGAFTYESDGWQLQVELANTESDIYIRKTASDAFQHTDLQTRLDVLQVNHLVICGMQSEFCVDSTVRRALALGYPVTVVEDGHTTIDTPVLAAASISAHHNHTWANLGSYGPRAIPVTAAHIEFER